MALGLDRSRIGLSGYYQATGAMRLIVSVKAEGSFRMARISTASCWRRSACISVLLDCSCSEVLPFKTGNASPRSSYISKTSDQVHFYDPKGALSRGDRAVVGVPNFGPDEGQVAGLVGGLGQAGKRAFLGWGQVLDVQIDGGATEARVKPGHDGPGHGGVHAGFCYYRDRDLYSNPYIVVDFIGGFDPPVWSQKEPMAGTRYFLLFNFRWLYFYSLFRCSWHRYCF